MNIWLYDEHDNETELYVEIDYFFEQPPMSNADNPDDYYGYVDCEYTVYLAETGEEVDYELSEEEYDELVAREQDSRKADYWDNGIYGYEPWGVDL